MSVSKCKLVELFNVPIFLILIFCLVQIGKWEQWSVIYSNVSILIAWCICTVLITWQLTIVSLEFKKIFLNVIFKDTHLKFLLQKGVLMTLISFVIASMLSICALVFLALEPLFIIVLVLDSFLLYFLSKYALRILGRYLESDFSILISLISISVLNYFLLYICYVASFFYSLDLSHATSIDEAISAAIVFEHGSHVIEILGRYSLALDNLTEALASIGISGKIVIISILMTKSLAPFIAFTLILRITPFLVFKDNATEILDKEKRKEIVTNA